MDLLKRSLAPLTDEAWKEIDKIAIQVLKTQLTARRFVDVLAPKGWNYAAVGLGRLKLSDKPEKGEVEYGVHRVQPLTEFRIQFKLNIWELDNIVRGAKDVDLKPLIAAARKVAGFEDQAVFHGFEAGRIQGMAQVADHPKMKFSTEAGSFLETLSEAMLALEVTAIGGPYALVLGPKPFRFAASWVAGYPLLRRIESLLKGPVIHSDDIEGGFLVSTRGGDLELTLGQDFSIGYLTHDTQHVELYLTESFTFRVLEPKAIVPFELAG